MASQLPPLPETSRLSPLVIRILGGNPGKFQLQGTNTYLIGIGPRRTLVDTGEGKPAWLASIKATLKSEACTIDTVILTHWHHDHVSGVDDLLDYLHPEKPVVYKNFAAHASPGQTDFADNHVFATQGATLTALHTPGHAADHMALHLAEEDACFTGDNVLGHGTAVFEDLAAYVASLQRLQRTFAGRAYPGHGKEITDGPGKVREYLAHREQREREILEVLAGGDGWGSMEVVKVVYREYPEALWGPAEGGVRLVLAKLEGDGRVRRVGGGGERWALSEKAAL